MNSSTEQRKLAGIHFTDIVGYSALGPRDEALALEHRFWESTNGRWS